MIAHKLVTIISDMKNNTYNNHYY